MKAHLCAKCAEERLALRACNNIAFVADAMLGNVARKLRIFGFDTLYILHTHDDEVLRTGIEQNRVILTADRELFARIVKAGAKGVLVHGGDNNSEDLVHILAENGITFIDMHSIGTRCSICNGILAGRAPEQIRNSIPAKVAESYSEFYQCVKCGKVYWEGSHFNKIKALAKSIELQLAQSANAS
jgi:uncharacterized protein with PIN domain